MKARVINVSESLGDKELLNLTSGIPQNLLQAGSCTECNCAFGNNNKHKSEDMTSA